MSRVNVLRLTTAGVLLAVAGLAQTANATVVSNNSAAFNIDFPLDGGTANGVERCGPRTIIQFDLAAGLQAAGVITDGAGLTAALVGLDAAGNPVTGAVNDVTAGLTVATYDNGAGNNNLTLDLSTTVTSSVFVSGVSFVALRVSTSNNNINTDGVQTVFDAVTEANDDTFVADFTRPSLTNVFISQDNAKLFFVFSEPLNSGAAANDPNHTVLANIDNNDFQAASTSPILGATVIPTNFDATGRAFTAGSNTSVIEFTRNTGTPGANPINIGTFVRANATDDAGNIANNDGFDRVANRVTSNTVQATAVTPISVLSASFIRSVPAGGGNVTGALRVVFNNPVSNAGNAAAYALINNSTNISDGGAGTEFVLSNPTVDPTNSSAVLLDVSSTGGADGISPDGRLTSSNGDVGGAVSARVASDGAGVTITEVTDIFGSSFGAGATAQTDVAAADAIAPSLLGGGPAYLDLNGDGAIDAAALIFDEPVGATTSTTGFELAVNNAVTVTPAFLINTSTGVLSATLPATVQSATQANRNIPITGVSVGSVAPVLGVAQTARTTNNAVIAAFAPNAFDWNANGTTRSSTPPDNAEAVPGNSDGGAINLIYNATTSAFNSGITGISVAAGSVADANGNRFTNGAVPTAVNSALAVDRAAPAFLGAVFFTGDNQTGGSNAQSFDERDGTNGDGNLNNRIGLIFSESLSQNAGGGVTDSLLSFGTSGNTFNDGDFLFRSSGIAATNNISNNLYTFGTVSGTTQTNAASIVPGVSLTLATPGTGDGGFSDAAGNQSRFTGRTAADGVAPYVALTLDVNQNSQVGAFTVDSNGDGFIDAIRVKFTQRIDSASLRQADFSVSGGGTLSGAPAVESTDNSVVNVPITDGVLSINNSVTLTYSGATTGASLVRAQAAPNGNGLAVDAVTRSLTVQRLQQPNVDTREIATMVVTGNVSTNGTTPAPVGTKVFMMNAVPTALSITSTHNNTQFTVGRFGSYSDSGSIDAWTNWILQLEPEIYLHNSQTNQQTYRNCKIISSTGNVEGNIALSRQVIRLSANASNLSRITFSGTGQSSSERVTGGSVSLCWDVLRSSGGNLSDLYNVSCGSGGYESDGVPIISRAVVSDNSGNYVMHHSGPVGGFNGRTRLDATNRPVIVVVETPDGRRFVASSLLTSVNGGPLLFKSNLGNVGSNGVAQGGVRFDINMANIAGGAPSDATNQIIWDEWNTVSYARDGGHATSSSNLPLLPSGVTPASNSASRIVVSNSLTATNSLNQFVFWNDTLSSATDGMWTSNDDDNGPFDGIIVDYKCFNAFAFAMTNRGVQLDSGITGFTGGYAFGIFNATSDFFGVFQFGPRFGSGVTSIFGTGSAAFPTNGSTKGWVLAAAAASATSGATFLSANADADYAIRFNNRGPNAGSPRIDVSSQSSTANGTGTPANANNLGAVPDEASLFVHYDR